MSKLIPFQIEGFRKAVGRAMQVGLHGFALTEHIHSPDFWKSAGLLAARYGY